MPSASADRAASFAQRLAWAIFAMLIARLLFWLLISS
jgi:hypothetical protein